MSEMVFAEAAVPTVTRTSAPNPFLPLADALATVLAQGDKVPADKRARVFTITSDSAENLDKEIASVKRHLSLGGNSKGITIRSTVVKGGTAKAPTATFTAWATAKVSRVRKPKGEAAAAK